MQVRSRLAILLAALLVLAVVPAASAESRPKVLGPGGTYYGKTYEQWAIEWQKWALSIPVHSPPFSDKMNHPLAYPEAGDCSVDQSGKVWFLGGVFYLPEDPPEAGQVVRNCTVPSSKALFFPILNYECSEVEPACLGSDPNMEGSLRTTISSAMDLIDPDGDPTDPDDGEIRVWVDGTLIPIDTDFRLDGRNTPLFEFKLPADNMLAYIGAIPPYDPDDPESWVPGKPYKAVDDGYYVMLAPLSKGEHTIHFIGKIDEWGVVLDFTYNLKVE